MSGDGSILTGESPARRWIVEGAVILFSILLAFAVDAAWDARAERRAERLIRESLIADFEAARDAMPWHIREHERTAAAAAELIRLVRDAEVGSWVTVPDTLIVFPIRNGSLDAPTGALDALLSSGDLRLIEDAALRRMLAAWPSRLRDATEDDRLLREFWGPEMRAILAEDVNLLGPFSNVSPGSLDPPGTSTPIRVTNRLRGIAPDVRGSSQLAFREESALLIFVDSILVRLRGGGE